MSRVCSRASRAGAFMARARQPEVAGRPRQRQRREHTGQQQGAQPRRAVRAGALQRRGERGELCLQLSALSLANSWPV